MASYRTPSAHAAAPAASPRPTRTPAAAPPAPAASKRLLKRAALYARVSTEKQEREDTVASQVDLLYKAVAASGYDIVPTSVFIDEGVSGARLDRPALDRLRDLTAEGAFEVLLVTVPDRLARPLCLSGAVGRGVHPLWLRGGLCAARPGREPGRTDAAPDARRVCRVRTGADSGTDAARPLVCGASGAGEMGQTPLWRHLYPKKPPASPP